MKYFPNNWQAIKDADPAYFPTLPFEQFIEWKENYQLPSSVYCLIREMNPKSKKVTEHTFTSERAAKRKFLKLMDQGQEFLVCHHGAIEQLYPES